MELMQQNPIMTVIVLLIQFPLFLMRYFPFQIIDQISIEELTRLLRRTIHRVMYRMNQIRLGMGMQQIIDRNINNVITANNEIVNETRIELRNNTNQTVQRNNEDVARTNLANTNTFMQNIVNGVTTFAQFFTGTTTGRIILINGLALLVTRFPELVNTWDNLWRAIAPRLPNIPFIEPPRELPTPVLPRQPTDLIPRPEAYDLEGQTTAALIDNLINIGRELVRRIFRP